jgi:hypothetical protein
MSKPKWRRDAVRYRILAFILRSVAKVRGGLTLSHTVSGGEPVEVVATGTSTWTVMVVMEW